MSRLLNLIRDFDLFAVPVSLTYKGKKRFNTLLGGLCSLLLLISFLTYSALTFHHLIAHPVLKSNSENIFFSLTGNTESY